VVLFFSINAIWIKLDKQVPFIGDDARYLQGTYDLYTPLKNGDLAKTWTTWQNLFISPQQLPRTPLFATLSVPSFLVFGPTEDIALITNVFVLGLNSLLIYYLVRLFFGDTKTAKLTGLVSVILYNLVPGSYGYARIYMSETLQTFFVLLITYQLFKQQRKQAKPVFFLSLGIFAALAFLLRFVIAMYLVIPAIWFVAHQLKLRKPLSYYLQALVLFLAGFAPVTLSWYGKNFATYYRFAKETGLGNLTQYYSLGPVFSPRTILRFWYVIVLWIFGWPLLLLSLISAALLGVTKIQQLKKLVKTSARRIFSSIYFYLIVLPLPALAATTLSDGKTARYFAPVIIFWLILLARVITNLLTQKKRKLAVAVMIIVVFAGYPFAEGVIPRLPHLPRTNFNLATARWDNTDRTHERYDFLLEFLAKYAPDKEVTTFVYNTAEQPRFNAAEMIWYATQHGYSLRNTDEFSRYSDLEAAYAKVDQSEVLIIESNPDAGDLWREKYTALRMYVLNHPDFFVVTKKQMRDGSVMMILQKNLTYGSLNRTVGQAI
jgi:hypothetical protein